MTKQGFGIDFGALDSLACGTRVPVGFDFMRCSLTPASIRLWHGPAVDFYDELYHESVSSNNNMFRPAFQWQHVRIL